MNDFYIPWKAWYGDEQLELTFPENWNVQIYHINDITGLSPEQIKSAFQNPIGTKHISEIAQGKKSAAIAVDDISRPTPTYNLLPEIIDQLKSGGISEENIKIIIATGAHQKLTEDELIKKLGTNIIHNFQICNHNPYDDLIDIGICYGNVPVKINKFFIESDLRIVAGSVTPHPFAGFSGGAKIVLPGLSDIKTIEMTHRAALMGFSGNLGEVEGNKFRYHAEQIANKIGVQISIHSVVNAQREIAGLFIGDISKAYYEAVSFAKKKYLTKADDNLDVVILNAYPKDTDLSQIENSFIPYRFSKGSVIHENGLVVITAACSKGLGYHGLFGPGMPLYREPVQKHFLGKRDLFLYSPNITHQDFKRLFWEGYLHFAEWSDVISTIKRKFPKNCNIGIFPCAPLQLSVINKEHRK